MAKKWFAVTSNQYNAWDDGSYDFGKAAEKALDAMNNGDTNVCIAEIDEEYNVCDKEYRYNADFERWV